MFTYTFEENDIFFSCDFAFYRGIPEIPFIISCNSNDSIELSAKGYGLRGDYGSGSILVKIAHLPESVKKVFRENFHLIFARRNGYVQLEDWVEEVRSNCIVHRNILFGPGLQLFWIKGMETHKLLTADEFDKELNARLEPWMTKRCWWCYRDEFQRFNLPYTREDGKVVGLYTITDPRKEKLNRMEILGI
jgi:hypothetical protein